MSKKVEKARVRDPSHEGPKFYDLATPAFAPFGLMPQRDGTLHFQSCTFFPHLRMLFTALLCSETPPTLRSFSPSAPIAATTS